MKTQMGTTEEPGQQSERHLQPQLEIQCEEEEEEEVLTALDLSILHLNQHRCSSAPPPDQVTSRRPVASHTDTLRMLDRKRLITPLLPDRDWSSAGGGGGEIVSCWRSTHPAVPRCYI